MKKKSWGKYVLVGVLSFIAGVVSVILLQNVANDKKVVSNDFETYLTYDNEFCENATIVMPSVEDLADSEIMCYQYRDENNVFSERSLFLTVKYSDEDFANEIQRLAKKFNDTGDKREFYLNGVFFKGFMFEYQTALAYHTCSDANTVTYILFQNENLQYMAVEDAMKYYLPTHWVCEYENIE